MSTLVRTVITSQTIDVYKNLAKEAVLIDQCQQDQMILFLWQSHSSIVIGKHQNPYTESYIKKLNQDKVHLARRESGGGTVYHDLGNLNYSFIVPKHLYDIKKNFEIILNALQSLGIKGTVNGRNDLIIDGMKFSGSAFIHKKYVCCHHGTLLINSDLERLNDYLRPRFKGITGKGIQSFRSTVTNLEDFSPKLSIDQVHDAVVASFCNYYPGSTSRQVAVPECSVNSIEKRYRSWEWMYGQTPAFVSSLTKESPWGDIDVSLEVMNGVITDIRIDGYDTEEEALHLHNMLKGCRFELRTIKEAVGNEDLAGTFSAFILRVIEEMF